MLASEVLKNQIFAEERLIFGIAMLPQYVLFWQLGIIALAVGAITAVRATFAFQIRTTAIDCKDFQVRRNI